MAFFCNQMQFKIQQITVLLFPFYLRSENKKTPMRMTTGTKEYEYKFKTVLTAKLLLIKLIRMDLAHLYGLTDEYICHELSESCTIEHREVKAVAIETSNLNERHLSLLPFCHSFTFSRHFK